MAPYYVCPGCNRQMRPKTNGVHVIEMADFGPYKVWHADLWYCPECKREVIAGFGIEPLAEHYQDRFAHVLETAKASGEVYYC